MSLPERLAPILRDVAERAALRRRSQPLALLRRETPSTPQRCEQFLAALGRPGLAIIAECKRRAPSSGPLSGESTFHERIQSYAIGGADALSILTEEDHFGGSLLDLQAAAAVKLPRLRKDFLLDEGMLLEAHQAGAQAVLLITACLDPVQLGELRAVAREVGLAVLLEVHDEAELEIALPLEPEALGVNARNLTTFEIDLATTERLLPQIPTHLLRVAESGMQTLADLQRMQAAGADAVLVGTALMQSHEPGQLLREWRAALDA